MTLKYVSRLPRHHVDTVSLATQAWNQNNCMKSLWIPSIAVDMIAWRRTWTRPVFGRKKVEQVQVFVQSSGSCQESDMDLIYIFFIIAVRSHVPAISLIETFHRVISTVSPLPMCGMTRHDHVDMLARSRAMSDDVVVNDGWSLLILQNACIRGLPGVVNYFVSSDVYKYNCAISCIFKLGTSNYKSIQINVTEGQKFLTRTSSLTVYSTALSLFLFVSAILIVLSTGCVCHHFLKVVDSWRYLIALKVEGISCGQWMRLQPTKWKCFNKRPV